MFHKIQTKTMIKMWAAMLSTKLFKLRDKLCCNPTPSIMTSLQQNCTAYSPTRRETKSYALKALQYAQSLQNLEYPTRLDTPQPCQ